MGGSLRVIPQPRYESERVRGSQSVQRVTASHDESEGVGLVPDQPLPYRDEARDGKKGEGDES